MSWFLTSFAQGHRYLPEIRGMMESFRAVHPDVPAIIGENPIPGGSGMHWNEITKFKAEWLDNVRRTNPDLGAMLWVDADARFRRPIEMPKDGPIVAMKYTRWCTGTVWFMEDTPDSFFLAWKEFCEDGEVDEDGFEKAMEFHEITPKEIGRSVSSVCSQTPHGWNQRRELEWDSAIVHWNLSRCQKMKAWPPPEEERRV